MPTWIRRETGKVDNDLMRTRWERGKADLNRILARIHMHIIGLGLACLAPGKVGIGEAEMIVAGCQRPIRIGDAIRVEATKGVWNEWIFCLISLSKDAGLSIFVAIECHVGNDYFAIGRRGRELLI